MVSDTYDTLRSKKYLIKVVDAKHDLAHESYLQEVRRAISNL